MPARLKEALVRETARRGSNVNDVAAGHPRRRVRRRVRPQRPAAQSASRLQPRPPAPRPAGAEGRDPRRGVATRLQRERRHPRRARGRARRAGTEQSQEEGNPWPLTNGSKNGARAKDKVRVAIIGVGNCANSLLQGVEYYKDAKPEDTVPGLMHVDLGGYHISDIEFTAAFDVVKGKVGVDLADAIWAHPNDTIKFADVTKTGIKVSRGMTHDGIGKYLAAGRREGAGPDRRRRRDPQGDRHGRGRQLPPGRLRGRDEVVRGADPRGGRRDGELHARLHRARAVLAEALRGRRRARSSATTSSRRSARRSRTAC